MIGRCPLRRFLAGPGALPFLLLLLGGCLSTHPGSASIAYVVIPNSTDAAIRSETIRVFQEALYKIEQQSPDEVVFIRDATQRDRVMYASPAVDTLQMRVVVVITSDPKGGHLLQADAYVVRDGDAEKVLKIASRPYQVLLENVRASLLTSQEPIGGVP